MLAPSNLLLKFSRRLFTNETERDSFIEALLQPQSFHPCILWCQEKPEFCPFDTVHPLPWQPDFVDRLMLGTKPGQHDLHQQGYFYCLDFSSVFAASVLFAISSSMHHVLDLCAAPGGKSIFAWKALQPEVLLANEAIGKRIGMLKSNLERCWVRPATIISLDSKVLAQSIPQTASLVMVDAPCTGQSLLAKGNKAPGCFHPVTINKNANRQKRILANAAKLVGPQGYLTYMTCAYSVEENEQVVTWFLRRFPQFNACAVPHLASYQSHLSDLPCYRMWPQQRLGAGAFTILFQNTEDGLLQPVSSEFLYRNSLLIRGVGVNE